MILAAQAPVCRIIAGPNGAGKTTFALKYLPQVAPGTAFINADLIAAASLPWPPSSSYSLPAGSSCNRSNTTSPKAGTSHSKLRFLGGDICTSCSASARRGGG
jgi:predicted ABC-type ATPase